MSGLGQPVKKGYTGPGKYKGLEEYMGQVIEGLVVRRAIQMPWEGEYISGQKIVKHGKCLSRVSIRGNVSIRVI